MRLASYKVRGRESFGVVVGEGVVDLAQAAPVCRAMDVFRAGALDKANAAAAGARPDAPLARSSCCRRSRRRKRSSASASTTPTATPTTATRKCRNIRACSIARPIRWSGMGSPRAAAGIRAARLRGRDRAGDRPRRPPHCRRSTRSTMSPASRCATKAPSATGSATASSTSRRARTGTRPAASAPGS